MLARTSYRADIDGLRAVAVLAILMFHLDPGLLPGGYLGVDVFFVISGFLITGQIAGREEGFSFREFYTRRLFRLYPALLAMVAATLVAGYVRLAPADFRSLGASALSAVFGVSNVWFLNDIDYFNPENAFRPLLHTWSLGVEEQFYLLWPLILVRAARLGSSPKATAAAVLALSLALSVLGLAQAGPAAAFYLMPFRIHEFAIGAAIRVLLAGREPSGAVAGAAGALGLAALAAALFVSGEGPTWALHWLALAPCLATAALIGTDPNSAVARGLGSPLPRLIGRWSYSIYLVHWPLIVFFRDWRVVPLEAFDLILLFVLSIALGAALHYAVERPLRVRGTVPAWPRLRLRWAGVGVGAMATMAFAGAVVAGNGLPHRIDRTRVQVAPGDLTFAGDVCSSKRSACTFGDRTSSRIVYLVGDSHALNLLYGLDLLFKEQKIRGIAFYDHGCPFLEGTRRFERGAPDRKCQAAVENAYASLAGDRNPVILAGCYSCYVKQIGPDKGGPFLGEGQDYEAWIEARLSASASRIASGGRRLVLMGMSYDAGVNVPACLARPGGPDEASCHVRSRDDAIADDKRFDDVIRRAASRLPSAVVLEPKDVFCPGPGCVVRDGATLYLRDSVHLTNAGSQFLVEGLRNPLLAALGDNEQARGP